MITTLIFVHFLALLSSGPNFFYVMTSSLNNEEKLKSVLVVTFLIIIWSILSALGLSIIITENKEIMHLITMTGIIYLFYLSLKTFNSIKEKIKKSTNINYTFLGGS
ncbi:LysE family transporter [Xenorhabdus sp. XENO-1]|uniref:LysE family translocator n=1 Tax=Xenorhabdus bovienii TaxID=40576 RepID=UPI0020CA9838|nr:LysE family transporter [Xenorhabdus bovienii]MCP9269637.1 LysE family transporter [Xenorhabdus bovienii subsp. africana]